MSVPYRFMITGAVFVVIGMLLGLYMGPSQDFTLVPVHVHLNLVGWASMMLFGLYYRSDAVAAGTSLAAWHYWIAVVGMILFAIGLAFVRFGQSAWEPVLIAGSILTLISALIFLWTLLRASQRNR